MTSIGFLEDIAISRKLRNLTRQLKSQPKNLVLIASDLTIPSELSEVVNVLDFPLPAPDEIHTEVERLLAATGTPLTGKALDELVRACQGLSMERIRRGPVPGDRHPWSAQCGRCGI